MAEGGRIRNPGHCWLHLFSRQGLHPRQDHLPMFWHGWRDSNPHVSTLTFQQVRNLRVYNRNVLVPKAGNDPALLTYQVSVIPFHHMGCSLVWGGELRYLGPPVKSRTLFL